jgi:sialate O-acetylesterase
MYDGATQESCVFRVQMAAFPVCLGVGSIEFHADPRFNLCNGVSVRRPLLYLSAVSSVVFSFAAASAEVRLPNILSDHAVLQRNAPIHIWGWASPGEQVAVSFHGQKQSTAADTLGKWSIYLQPERAGGPYDLTVTGTNTVTLSDLLVGDVWFASGQSNMEMPLAGFPGSAVLKDGPNEIAHANLPQVRLLVVDKKSSSYPLDNVEGTWTACTPETAAKFSAVAYFFGREIQAREHVPLGLIDDTWGGTPAEAWVSLDGLASNASLMPVFTARAEMIASQIDVTALIAREQREDAAAKAANQPLPKHGWHPDPSSWEPAGLFNAMVAPVVNFPIKGVIWYQGESNSSESRALMYSRVFPALISDWRSKWHQGNFPFLFVQISSFKSNGTETWGIIRDAQRRSLELTDTAMAVSLDVGDPDNVHPPDKQTVGSRLALAARAMVYGEALEYSGPLFRQANVEGTNLRVWFNHAGGLAAKGGSLEGFEVAGADHQFATATAHIDGESIVVTAPGVSAPIYVRYAWANAPEANLYNSAGLPASTFTSEDVILPPCAVNCKP